jgi:hypothetical protein
VAYGLAFHLGRLDGVPAKDKAGSGKPVSRGRLIVLLAVGVALLYPLVGALYDFHHGAASGSLIVDIIWRVVWIGFTLVRLGLIVLLVMAGHHYLKNRRQGLGTKEVV